MNKEQERNPRKALGKGLSALLPARGTSTATAPAPVRKEEAPAPPAPAPVAAPLVPPIPEQFETFQNIPLDQIRPNQDQPRSNFDAQSLDELAQSIRANGLIQPITVMKGENGKYTLIAGERRWRAAHFAGLKEIPALVRTVQQDKMLELALIENIQREDLNPVEAAMAFQRLVEEHGLSHEDVAERTGKDRSTITNFLRLLRLAPLVLNELSRGNISVGHARALLNITDPEAQFEICEQITANQLSVRETETLVKNLANKPKDGQDKPGKKEPPRLDPNIRAALEELTMALGTKVRIIPKSANAGRIEVEYYSQDDLDRIYSVITKQQ
jgi:ParB family transcriptional regulator, chromosome partitioning protein